MLILLTRILLAVRKDASVPSPTGKSATDVQNFRGAVGMFFGQTNSTAKTHTRRSARNMTVQKNLERGSSGSGSSIGNNDKSTAILVRLIR